MPNRRYAGAKDMHKSRLAGFIIDCRTEDLDAAARFWSAALGLPLRPAVPEDSAYRLLATAADQPHLEVQRVDHPSRVHLDIEADDIEAEVVRLERLGARRVGAVRTWYVMEAPSGQRFCVVRPQRPDFAARANSWD
jgi:catechol 2,3-dioxygenase-like lactoylglutathione lyase family enzyme